jgi:nucleotide-binding universal stress UspA family protein
MSPTAETPETPEQSASQAPYRVIAACDFSAIGDRAVVEALRICTTQPGVALHVIVVAAESPAGVILPGPAPHVLPIERAEELAREHVARLVDEYVAQGLQLGLEKIAVYVATGSPSERIVALALSVDADLIVLGTHGRHGWGRILLGSVAEEVVKRAPCGVFVIRPRDFLEGEKLPEVQPPLQPGEHALLPFRTSPTYHYLPRASEAPSRLMPAL